MLETNTTGTVQECKFPCLFFLEAIGLSLWENDTSKDLLEQLNQLITEVSLKPNRLINYQY